MDGHSEGKLQVGSQQGALVPSVTNDIVLAAREYVFDIVMHLSTLVVVSGAGGG